MDTFLEALTDLIASAEDITVAEIIGALEITKQQVLLDLFSDDDEEPA